MDKASVIRMTTAVLAALKLILNVFGIEIPQEMTDALVDLVAAVWVVYTSWRNNYISKKGLTQKKVLKEHHLL